MVDVLDKNMGKGLLLGPKNATQVSQAYYYKFEINLNQWSFSKSRQIEIYFWFDVFQYAKVDVTIRCLCKSIYILASQKSLSNSRF
jgi:hypothetical protein